jgi:hypothetical protein
LHHRFAMGEDVYRVLFTTAPAPKAVSVGPATNKQPGQTQP